MQIKKMFFYVCLLIGGTLAPPIIYLMFINRG